MGYPGGWVTGVPGLTRKDQLKAIGNGAVPLQAAEAIVELLRRTDDTFTRHEPDDWGGPELAGYPATGVLLAGGA